MGRLAILDGLRGYFLVFMLVNHLPFGQGFWLVHVNHAELGYVQDAQGFVFLSGLLLGLGHTRHALRGDVAVVTRRILQRALKLYAFLAAIILFVLVAGTALDGTDEFWGAWLGPLWHETGWYVVAAGALLYQPTYMDILPQYILYLLAAPWLIRLVARDRAAEVAAGSLILWLAVQLGAHLPVTAAVTTLLRSVHPSLGLRAYFNPLAWQVVFVGGLLAGATSAARQIDWQRWFDPGRSFPLKLGLAVLTFFLVWRLGFTFQLWGEPLAERFWSFDRREEFSLVYLLSFAAAAHVIAWLLIAGGRAPHPLARLAAAGLRRLLTAPFLGLIGRHSLQVYTYHVLLVYGLAWLEWHAGPFGWAIRTLLALAAIASLSLPAWLREVTRRPRSVTVPASG